MNNPNDYRVGDRVVIAPDGWLKEKGIAPGLKDSFRGTDRVVTLKNFSVTAEEWCIEKESGDAFFWIPEAAILGHAFEWGEKIEVFDEEDNMWYPSKFRAYVPGMNCYVRSEFFGYRFARPIRKEEKIEHAEPEIFWGKLDGIYYSTPHGSYEPEDIAKHYQANYPDWEFLGFYEENRDFSGLTCGSWHAEKQYPGGVIKLLPWVKFRRKA